MRLGGRFDQAAVGLFDGVEEGAVADVAAVEEEVLVFGGGAGGGGLSGEAMDAYRAAAFVFVGDGDEFGI